MYMYKAYRHVIIVLISIFSFGVFSLPGDPINVEYLGSFLSSQQLVHYDEDKRTLFMKTALERQHKVASLAFYSTISKYKFND